MNIEEIKQAKREAEGRIQAVVQASQERIDEEVRNLTRATGMEVLPPDVRYVECSNFNDRHKRMVVSEVRIELRVP